MAFTSNIYIYIYKCRQSREERLSKSDSIENGKWLSTSFETFLFRFFYFYSNIFLLFFPLFLSSIFISYRKEYCFEPPIDIDPRKSGKTFSALASIFVKLAPPRNKRKNEGIQRVVYVVLSTPCWDETPFRVLEKRGARVFFGFSLSLSPFHYSRWLVAQIMRVTSEEGMHERGGGPSQPGSRSSGITTWTARKR